MTLATRAVLVATLTVVPLACGRPQHEYPTEFVDNFRSACRAKGGTEDGCECALARIRERFTADEYRDIEARLVRREEAAAQALADVTADCRGK